MIVSDSNRAILTEQQQDADPGRCPICNDSGWLYDDDLGDGPCPLCAPDDLCEMCHTAPAVTMAGETLLCGECDNEWGLRIARKFALSYQPSEDLADLPF